MNIFLLLAFLFYIGSTLGWIAELLFRRFKLSNKDHCWVNPGFLIGPYLPLYGFGLDILFLCSLLKKHIPPLPLGVEILVVFIFLSVLMTLLELIAGEIFIVGFKVKLWDYTTRKWNYKGIICPLFSVIWGVVGLIYTYFIHAYITKAIMWFSNNLAFSFVVGLFFGVFIVDVCYSLKLTTKIRKFAKESRIVVLYEDFKQSVRIKEMQARGRRARFLLSIVPRIKSLKDYVEEWKNEYCDKVRTIKKK